MKQVIAIFNPTKVAPEDFHQMVNKAAEKYGFEEPSYLETTADDPGYQMADKAIKAEPDLVLVAGGDGTVRIVCSKLVNTGLPIGLIPAGTGNLLARNLDLPLNLSEAVDFAFTNTPRPIDAIKVIVDGKDDAEHLMVMGGIGFDAQLMNDTNEQLKAVVGSGAYVESFLRNFKAPLRGLRYWVDDDKSHTKKASLTLIANVAKLQGGVSLVPTAKPDDGQLDLLVASPKGLAGWAKMLRKVLFRKHGLTTAIGKRIRIKMSEPTPYEFDGDTLGEGTYFEFSVVPESVAIIH